MLKGLLEIGSAVVFCTTLVAFSYQPKIAKDNLQARFIISAFICGLFFYSYEISYFDPKYKLFGVMANVLIGIGAVTGGVVGKLNICNIY